MGETPKRALVWIVGTVRDHCLRVEPGDSDTKNFKISVVPRVDADAQQTQSLLNDLLRKYLEDHNRLEDWPESDVRSQGMIEAEHPVQNRPVEQALEFEPIFDARNGYGKSTKHQKKSLSSKDISVGSLVVVEAVIFLPPKQTVAATEVASNVSQAQPIGAPNLKPNNVFKFRFVDIILLDQALNFDKRYFVMDKDISINYEEDKYKLKELKVISNDDVVLKYEFPEQQQNLEYRWTLPNKVLFYPNRDDQLEFCVTYNQRRGLGRLFKSRNNAKLVIKRQDIVEELRKRKQLNAKISIRRAVFAVSLEVLGRELSFCVGDMTEDVTALLSVQADIDLKNLHEKLLGTNPVSEDTLPAIKNVIAVLDKDGNTILPALCTLYKMLERKPEYPEYNGDVKDLAEIMVFVLQYLVGLKDSANASSIWKSPLVRTLRSAALYVNAYDKKVWIGRFVTEQLSNELRKRADLLIRERNDLEFVMNTPIRRDAHKIASSSVDEVLQKYLDPVEDDEQLDSCLEGTRTKILEDIRLWLQNPGQNILWLEGPPGAGKSTITSTIANELATNSPHCVVFSCKRDVPDLRDPRRVWPTLAFKLAGKHDGIKAALISIVNEKKDELQRYSVAEQFKKLIKAPLDTDYKLTSRLSRRPAYPVIIIDDLDGCCMPDDDGWDSLLESLVCWSELCTTGIVVKLVVASRHRDDISAKLDQLSRVIRLSTEDDVSTESKSDVRTFFKSKFAEIRNTDLEHCPPNWPGEVEIDILTNYAAGLFIWADMVVQYVRRPAGGNDPTERLQKVLKDVARPSSQGIDGAPQVDRLYARVLFEAFLHASPVEIARAKSALATIVLANEPLGSETLVDLLSTDNWDAREATNSTLQMLSPIILNVDGKLQVCHKTVSDFLLSRDRSEAAMGYVVEQWRAQSPPAFESDPHSLSLDPEEEEKSLALACMRLLCRKFTEDTYNVEKLPKPPRESFSYAFDHWFEHLMGAPVERKAPAVLKSLMNAMKIAYGCLNRYIGELERVKEDASALIKILRSAADLTVQFIDHDRNIQQPIVVDIHQEVTECARNLDIVRGEFQIAMIENLASESSDLFLRKWLQPVDQTVLDSPCLEGTRTSVLNRAKDWLEDLDKPNILWIVGGPGVGKSAIATSLVEVFSNLKGEICAKIFVKRDFEDRRDPTRIWSTLTYDLAKSGLHLGLKGSIVEGLFKESRRSVQVHYDVLIEALRDQQHLSAVFIIDALDECVTEGELEGRSLLQALAGWVKLPRSLKLVVTSRDISEIREVLESISSSLSLDTTDKESKKEAESDTETYLRTIIDEELKGLEDTRSYWTRADVIHSLVKNAAGSFIWAKMIIELVKVNPLSRLDDILDYTDSRGAKVDLLYAKVLFDILGPLNEEDREIFRSALTFVVLAKIPLREADLVDLLQASPSLLSTGHQVANVIKELASVISIGDNQLLRIPHKSFSDFLLDHDRSLSAMKQLLPADYDPHSFIVNRKMDDTKITIACLQLMNSTLKFNACGIATSDALNDEIPELEERISENTKTSLIYACYFWAEHLNDCSREAHQFLVQIVSLLDKLLNENLLYWLEILSLTKAVPSAGRSLQIVQDLLEGFGNGLPEVINDARQFVEMFEEPIAAAVPHIYLSAIPFCPSDSRISRIYGPKYPNVLSFTKRREMDRDARDTMPDTDEVNSVAFFPDGRVLASGSDDGTVRIWDVKTGQELSEPFTGHDGSVRSIAVSPDASQIASGVIGGVLRIWDTDTVTCPLGPINAHRYLYIIRSVAFSPDGTRIVTGSSDDTVKVWNVATGDLCLGPLTGHTDDVRSVAFSIDGTAIASGSDDRTIRIWDACTGESWREALMGHTDWVRCVAFSADGRYLASGSDDKTIRLWDVVRGFSLMRSVTVGSEVHSVAFSPNSKYLVSGSGDGTLHFWNVGLGIIEPIGDAIDGHAGIVWSVAFAPDGQSVASGSADCSIKIWSVSSSTMQHPAATANRKRNRFSSDRDREPLDSSGFTGLDDSSFIDDDGWMRTSRREGAGVLFWVPKENRGGVWWPRNTAVIHANVTKFDFRRFVHGENWTQCRTSSGIDGDRYM